MMQSCLRICLQVTQKRTERKEEKEAGKGQDLPQLLSSAASSFLYQQRLRMLMRVSFES